MAMIQPWLKIMDAKRLNRLRAMGYVIDLAINQEIAPVCSACLGHEELLASDGGTRPCLCQQIREAV